MYWNVSTQPCTRINWYTVQTASLHFLIIADCPSYTAVHRRRSGLPCCRCSYLEQSASFPWTRYHNFCSICAMTVIIFGQLNRSFYLLTYLFTYLVTDTFTLSLTVITSTWWRTLTLPLTTLYQPETTSSYLQNTRYHLLLPKYTPHTQSGTTFYQKSHNVCSQVPPSTKTYTMHRYRYNLLDRHTMTNVNRQTEKHTSNQH